MHRCTPVGLDFFRTAPHLFTAEQIIRARPDDIFTSFERAEDWPAWAPAITKVIWTCDKPYRLGSTRSVHMMGGLIADEVFIAWEREREMAFCFTAISHDNTIESFAEHYRVDDLGDGRCRVRWTMAMAPKGASRWSLKLFGPVMGLAVKWMLKRFRTLLESRAL